MTDKKTGEFSGIVADVFETIESLTGLTFQYIEGEKNEESKADIIASYDLNFDAAYEIGYNITSKYLSLPMTLVTKRNGQTESTLTATAEYYYSYKTLEATNDLDFLLLDTVESCLDAVKSGLAKQAIINSYSVNEQLLKTKYNSLQETTMQAVTFDICMAVNNDYDPRLLSILNKSIAFLSEADMNDIIIRNTIGTQDITLSALINQMPVDIVILFVSLFFVIVILMLLMT